MLVGLFGNDVSGWRSHQPDVGADWSPPHSDAMDLEGHLAEVAVPRLQLLRAANVAYAQHDLQTAIDLYEQAATTPPSSEESTTTSAAIDGLARFRELVGLTAIGDEEQARRQVALLAADQRDEPFARLAAQFWDQYGMTSSARAACAQLAPQVETQARPALETLGSLSVQLRHDEVCVVPWRSAFSLWSAYQFSSWIPRVRVRSVDPGHDATSGECGLSEHEGHTARLQIGCRLDRGTEIGRIVGQQHSAVHMKFIALQLAALREEAGTSLVSAVGISGVPA